MEKALWPQWNITAWFIGQVEKVWFHEKSFFELLMVMVKEERKYNKKMKFQ